MKAGLLERTLKSGFGTCLDWKCCILLNFIQQDNNHLLCYSH